MDIISMSWCTVNTGADVNVNAVNLCVVYLRNIKFAPCLHSLMQHESESESNLKCA